MNNAGEGVIGGEEAFPGLCIMKKVLGKKILILYIKEPQSVA